PTNPATPTSTPTAKAIRLRCRRAASEATRSGPAGSLWWTSKHNDRARREELDGPSAAVLQSAADAPGGLRPEIRGPARSNLLCAVDVQVQVNLRRRGGRPFRAVQNSIAQRMHSHSSSVNLHLSPVARIGRNPI